MSTEFTDTREALQKMFPLYGFVELWLCRDCGAASSPDDHPLADVDGVCTNCGEGVVLHLACVDVVEDDARSE